MCALLEEQTTLGNWELYGQEPSHTTGRQWTTNKAARKKQKRSRGAAPNTQATFNLLSLNDFSSHDPSEVDTVVSKLAGASWRSKESKELLNWSKYYCFPKSLLLCHPSRGTLGWHNAVMAVGASHSSKRYWGNIHRHAHRQMRESAPGTTKTSRKIHSHESISLEVLLISWSVWVSVLLGTDLVGWFC